jgi:hypothetical protein
MLGVKGSYNLIKRGLLVASDLVTGLSQHFKHSTDLVSDAVRELLEQKRLLILLVVMLTILLHVLAARALTIRSMVWGALFL